jgi:hypothetical protein
MAQFYWKRHDTSQIQAQLKDETGAPVNLTGATVKFTMNAVGSPTPKINAGSTTIITAASGIVGFKPTSSQTDTSGQFNAEWQVTFADTTVTTFPNNGNDTVTITDDLDNA